MRPAVNHALGGLCENCVTECCTVVMGTAFAMGVPPVRINNFGYLHMKWRTPKAGVTGSNPVGRANLFKWLRHFRCQANNGGAHLVPKRCPFLMLVWGKC